MPIRMSIVSLVGTVAFFALAATFPGLTVPLAVLAILAYFVSYFFLVFILPRKQRQRLVRDIWVRELTPEALKEWYAAGRITREEWEKMMRSLEEHH